MGRLEDHQRVAEIRPSSIERPALARLRRRETGEGEGVRRQAGDDQRGDRRGGTGDRLDADSRGGGFPDQQKPGIGEERRARIAGERDRLAVSQIGEETWQTLALVVLVERDERLPDAEMREQAAGVAGVFAGDQIGRLEGGAGARREVVEIADRRGDDQELAAHQSRGISWSRLTALPERRAMSIRRRLKRNRCSRPTIRRTASSSYPRSITSSGRSPI